MRVTSTIGMRRACPSCSTSTAVGRFQTNPPFGQRTTSARDQGVTVTSWIVTGSADASRAATTSMTGTPSSWSRADTDQPRHGLQALVRLALRSRVRAARRRCHAGHDAGLIPRSYAAWPRPGPRLHGWLSGLPTAVRHRICWLARLPQQDRLRGECVSGSLPFVDAYGDAGLGLLGDPTRRAIFELLARRPSSVGELAEQLPISRPAVSQHLRLLKDGGLVVSQPEGTRRVYRLNPDGVTALRAYLDRIWTDALTAFQKAAETAPLDPQPQQEER